MAARKPKRRMRRSLLETERVLVLQYDGMESQRLDHFLVSQIPEHSRSFLQGLIRDGHVKIDGATAQKSGVKLDNYHVIEVCIPPPKPYFPVAQLPLKVQLVSVGLLASLSIPPPAQPAELPLNVQFVSLGLEEALCIPPPLYSPAAKLPLNVQLVNVGSP